MKIKNKISLICLGMLLHSISYCQSLVLKDHNVSVEVKVNKLSDTTCVINTLIHNYLSQVIFTREVDGYYRKLVIANSAYFYFNAGLFNKSFGPQPSFATLIKPPPFERIELVDTLCIPLSVKKIIMDISIDYLPEDIVLDKTVKCENNVKFLPSIYFVRINEYKMYGKYLNSKFQIENN